MDFARPHVLTPSTVSKSNIRYLDPVSAEEALGETAAERESNAVLDNEVIAASNQIAMDTLHGSGCPDSISTENAWKMDSSLYQDSATPESNHAIQAGDLVVIQESFDKLDFVYCKPGDVYSNRNGHFHHDDFIGQPFGTKLRSRTHQGYGFLYLLKPTPELWTRSLNHRTQVVHELDQSQIAFQLYLRPNDHVVESGTGSGAMSHAFLRLIAPAGHLHTFEFNRHRSETASIEFAQHGLGHLVTVHHKDVCYGKTDVSDGNETTENHIDDLPGFDLPLQSVDAVFLDLPEPWVAVPHAAFVLKPNARIATYSPCMEQTQRTCQALENSGFHSIKTLEYRLQEHYVDDYEYESIPVDKRPRPEPHNVLNYKPQTNSKETSDKSLHKEKPAELKNKPVPRDSSNVTIEDSVDTDAAAAAATVVKNGLGKRKKQLVARPFVMMRGHTAFLTFATAGNAAQPNPNHPTENAAETEKEG